MVRNLPLLLFAAAALHAQISSDLELLTKIRFHELEQLRGQPNYTCVETVERSQRASATRKFALLDTLRLEVALVGPKELFAWPGAKKFEDIDLSDMVGRGAIGNGAFALHARAVFEGRAATFVHRGEEHLEGLPPELTLVRFDYKVPLMMSGYQIKVGTKKAVVGYHGSFWADPKTLDLRRMDVFADDIPPEIGLASASDRVDYARLHIGEADFLLPSGSELRMVDLNGTENRNLVRFTACRQYSGESVVSFADPAPETESQAPAPPPVRELELPPGVELRLALSEAIDIKKTAVGDAVEARVTNDVKYKGALVIPKGAIASGRVSALEHHTEYHTLGLTFTEIEAEGLHAKVTLSLEDIVGLGKTLPRMTHVQYLTPRRGEGVIYLPSAQTKVSRGTLLNWRN